MSNILYIVVPCYNEQEVLPETSKRLREKVQTLRQSGKIDADSRILFVNDGSKDATWEMVQKLHEENSVFSGVNLSRNRGHQNALLAGIGVHSEEAIGPCAAAVGGYFLMNIMTVGYAAVWVNGFHLLYLVFYLRNLGADAFCGRSVRKAGGRACAE